MLAAATRPTDEPIRDALRQRIRGGHLELPVLPRVANRVLQMAADPNTAPAELAEIITHDPAFSAHVLRVANSVLYAGGAKIVSVRQAVARLGMVNLAEIAVSIALKGTMFRPGAFQAEIAHHWKTAVVTALFAKEVARVRRQAVEAAFLCGLIHNVGKPIVLHALHDLVDKGYEPPDSLGALYVEFHVEAGLSLCDPWELPAAVAACIAHAETATPPPHHIEHVWTIRLARHIALAIVAPEADEPVAVPARLATALNLYPEDITKIVSVRDRVEESLGDFV